MGEEPEREDQEPGNHDGDEHRPEPIRCTDHGQDADIGKTRTHD